MKKILTLNLALLLFFGCAVMMQTIPSEELVHQKVYELDLSKKEIYQKSLEWLAKTFISSKEVIELKDEDSGKIIGKGITEFTNVIVKIPCRYTITIEAKENRYRITFDTFIGLWGEYHNNPKPINNEMERKYLTEVKNNLDLLAEDLFTYLKSDENNDW